MHHCGFEAEECTQDGSSSSDWGGHCRDYCRKVCHKLTFQKRWQLLILALDSDTVAPTLVFLFYELALHPEKAEKLYQEVKGLDVYDPKVLQRLPYLNAVIKETLRLHPAVPTGGYRDTPSQGMTIGETFIPGNTTIVAPRYVLGRCETTSLSCSSLSRA